MNIKEKRLNLKMTQCDLANKIGVSCKTISAYEIGNRSPNITMLKKLSEVFDCSIDELFQKQKTKERE